MFVHGNNDAVIHSFAHGGGVYHLMHDVRAIEERLREAGRHAVDALVANIFAAALTRGRDRGPGPAGIRGQRCGIRAMSARLKGERRKRAKEDAKKSRDAALAEIEAGGRLVRHRPGDDDELTPDGRTISTRRSPPRTATIRSCAGSTAGRGGSCTSRARLCTSWSPRTRSRHVSSASPRRRP